MSGRLLVALAALASGGALAGPASAAPERGLLVIEGRGGSTTTWLVTQPVTLRQPLPSQLRGGGEYTGVLIEPLEPTGGSGRLGAVQVRAFRDGTSDHVAPLGADGSLEPGRYRVTLLGAGPVRAAYPLSPDGAAGLRVVPSTPIPVTFLGRAELMTAGVSEARIDLPGALPAGRRAIQVGLSDGLAVEDYRFCATTAQTCNGNPLPLCPPAPLPCGDPALVSPRVGSGPSVAARLHEPASTPRALRWSAEGYHDSDQRLRGAAIIF